MIRRSQCKKFDLDANFEIVRVFFAFFSILLLKWVSRLSNIYLVLSAFHSPSTDHTRTLTHALSLTHFHIRTQSRHIPQPIYVFFTCTWGWILQSKKINHVNTHAHTRTHTHAHARTRTRTRSSDTYKNKNCFFQEVIPAWHFHLGSKKKVTKAEKMV